MFSAQQKVARFHSVFGCYPYGREDSNTSNPPHLPPTEVMALRLNLMLEELIETANAAGCRLYRDGDPYFAQSLSLKGEASLPGVADGIADLLYVTLGTAVACGINIDPIFEAVHNANMAKIGGTVRADGKILKPEGWTPPDIEGELVKQGWVK